MIFDDPKPSPGIFKFDGDKLIIYRDWTTANERPESFSTKRGDNVTVRIMKRVENEDDLDVQSGQRDKPLQASAETRSRIREQDAVLATSCLKRFDEVVDKFRK